MHMANNRILVDAQEKKLQTLQQTLGERIEKGTLDRHMAVVDVTNTASNLKTNIALHNRQLLILQTAVKELIAALQYNNKHGEHPRLQEVLDLLKPELKKKRTMSVEKRRLVEELHAPTRKNFPRRRVIVRGYDDLWQADVVEMRPYSRFNKSHNYILTVIDVLSKYAWALPLKSKGGKEVAATLSKLFRESARCPKNLQTDKGKEFYNADVQEASVVERFNRTLKNMWKMFTLNGSYVWINELSNLLSRYNRRIHRTIRMRPVDVTPEAAERLLSTVYSRTKIAAPGRFKIDDAVRVSKVKTIFEKEYTPNWTTEIFRIAKVQQTNPVTCLLKDYRGQPIAGGFYEHELSRVANPDVYLLEKVLRRKGNEVYVKWLGMDNSHNSWIHKTDVL
ncbi:PREDICTED: uncharacterized protein LOC105556609 [Vollenhovia emeryi]|uniref:uncharacterized protein LOC105556609 n=1 Tax=Vollenhovia emeryi TaxID=411798 RepID=UPI0005F432E6|nr:PREDICTED: uncharacterized protein LOC105556609 [Vollenhovia emeryi]